MFICVILLQSYYFFVVLLPWPCVAGVSFHPVQGSVSVGKSRQTSYGVKLLRDLGASLQGRAAGDVQAQARNAGAERPEVANRLKTTGKLSTQGIPHFNQVKRPVESTS